MNGFTESRGEFVAVGWRFPDFRGSSVSRSRPSQSLSAIAGGRLWEAIAASMRNVETAVQVSL